MRAFVFTDESLGRRAGQFVWLAIDTEKKENAAFKKRFGVDALPTFFVLDSKTESVALRWVGGATLPQLQKLLNDGRRATGGDKRGFDALVARADRLYGEGKNAEAAKAYREALAAAPAKWPGYGRAVESLLFALDSTHDPEGCAREARDAYGRLAASPSAANVAGSGLGCALSIPAGKPGRAEQVEAFRSDALRVVRSHRTDLAADDVSSVYQVLEEERAQAGDAAGKKALLEEHAAFLEQEAARAKSPDRRAVFDSHRLGAYLELGQPERAIPMLEASEKDFPDDYNPSARLASAYRAMKRWDDAAAASDRALAKAYGPRRLLILQNRADIEAGRGDAPASRRFLEEALRTAEAMPEGQKSEATIASLRKKLAATPTP